MNCSRPFFALNLPFALIFSLCLLTSLFSSCDSDIPKPTERNGVLRFSVKTNNMRGKSTRSGDEVDNRIKEVRVVCFDTQGKMIGNYGPEKVSWNGVEYSIQLERPDVVENIAVLANWEEYKDVFADINSLEELRNKSVEYIPPTPLLIPMFGESRYSEAGDCTVELVRNLAKVEIWDNMEEYEILSAVIKDYGRDITPGGIIPEETAGKELEFTIAEGGEYLYAYIPPITLNEEESDRRKIELKLRNEANGAEEDYELWLKDYTTEKENGNEVWTQIEGNHRYVFNIKGIDTPTPPEVEEQGKLEIRWWPTRYGKFMLYEYIPSAPQSCRLLLKDSESGKVIIRTPEADDYNDLTSYTNYDGYFELYVNLDLDEEGVKLENISWMVIDLTANGISNPEDAWNDTYAEKLSDIPVAEEEGVSRIRLTTVPILFKDGPSGYETNGKFPTSGTYRICWKNPDFININQILFSNNTDIKRLNIYQLNLYNYVEYNITSTGIRTISLKVTLQDTDGYTYTEFLDDDFQTNDFYVETIDGKEYYVLYLD